MIPTVAYLCASRADFDDRYAALAGAVERAGAEVVVAAADGEGEDGIPGGGPLGVATRLTLLARWSQRAPHIVHVLDTSLAPAAMWAAARCGAKVIVSLSGAFESLTPPGPGYALRRRLRYTQLRDVLAEAEGVVAPHRAARDSWVQVGVPEARVILLDSGLGVPLDELLDGPSPAERRQAARAALGLDEGAWVIAARGPRQLVTDTQAEVAAAAEVTWLALSDDPAARRQAVEAADVVASLEPVVEHAVALQEAMVLGKPVVATRVGGHSEIVRHGHSGVLVAPGDAAAAAQGVLALADPDVRADAGDRARALAARLFDRDIANRKILAAYDALLGGPGAQPASMTASGQVVGRELT